MFLAFAHYHQSKDVKSFVLLKTQLYFKAGLVWILASFSINGPFPSFDFDLQGTTLSHNKRGLRGAIYS